MDISQGGYSFAQQAREYELNRISGVPGIASLQNISTAKSTAFQVLAEYEPSPAAIVSISEIAREAMVKDSDRLDDQADVVNQVNLEQKEQNQQNLQQFVSSAQKLSQLDVVQIRLENRAAIESYKLIENKVVDISGVNDLDN